MYQHVFDENRQTDMRNCFLNELAPLGMLRHYSKRDEINQSFIGQAVAIVVDGKVCKSILSSTGQQRLLYTLRPGEMIGEMSLMCGGNLGYQLRAKEDSDISFVGMDALNKALEAKPSIYRHLLNSVTRKNRILLLQLTGATFNNAYGSIADALLRLAACSDTMDSKWAPDTISTSFTQAELAHNTGCSRVTVTRVLNRFVEEKIISIRDRRIVIHDIAALTAYTDTCLTTGRRGKMIKLIGVVIVIAGLLLRFNTLLVVLVAGFATGLVAGMSPVEILEAIGKAFVTNRYMSLLILVLPVIGILERFGMREKAEDAIRRMKMLTAGRVMFGYQLVRQITVGLGLHVGGHPSFVRPIIAPMTEAASAREGVKDERWIDRIRAMSASADNYGNFFGQLLFPAAGGLLLIKGVLDAAGYNVDLMTMAKYAIPTAVAAAIIAFVRFMLLDKKLREAAKREGEGQ